MIFLITQDLISNGTIKKKQSRKKKGKEKRNEKVTSKPSFSKAIEEIKNGKCIPLTKEEHNSVHTEKESQNWGPCNFPKGSGEPMFEEEIFEKVCEVVQTPTNMDVVEKLKREDIKLDQ